MEGVIKGNKLWCSKSPSLIINVSLLSALWYFSEYPQQCDYLCFILLPYCFFFFLLKFKRKNNKNINVVWKPVVTLTMATKVTACLLCSHLKPIWSLPSGLPVSAGYFWLGKKMTQHALHLPIIQGRRCTTCLKLKVKKSDKGHSCLRLLGVIRGERHQNMLCATEVLFRGETFCGFPMTSFTPKVEKA